MQKSKGNNEQQKQQPEPQDKAKGKQRKQTASSEKQQQKKQKQNTKQQEQIHKANSNSKNNNENTNKAKANAQSTTQQQNKNNAKHIQQMPTATHTKHKANRTPTTPTTLLALHLTPHSKQSYLSPSNRSLQPLSLLTPHSYHSHSALSTPLHLLSTLPIKSYLKGLFYWAVDRAQSDMQAQLMTCAGELNRADNTYKVSTWAPTLTKHRVENSCWDGYHVKSVLAVVDNVAPEVVIAYAETDKQKVWNSRRQASQCEISCAFTHMVFCAWHTYVTGC